MAEISRYNVCIYTHVSLTLTPPPALLPSPAIRMYAQAS